MKELLEKAINNFWNEIDGEGTFKTFCEIYEKTGDEEAEFYMGKMLYLGIGTEKNWEKAYQIMEKLYDRDRNAREVIADMYYYGEYLEEDGKKAFDIYTELVTDGGEDTRGYFNGKLGKCYYFGIGTEVDFKKAFELFKRATELGNKYAYFYLANMYFYGEGVEKNLEKAFETYKKSAEFGDERAYLPLGEMYYLGEGVEQDFKKAFEYTKKSLEFGDEKAYIWLAHMYYYGEGVEKNLEKAFEYTKKSAELEDTRAYLLLGHMYFYGEGTEKNDKEAVKWLTKSVEKENKEAQSMLGAIYFEGKEHGIDIEENKEYGLELLLKGAEGREKETYGDHNIKNAIGRIEVLTIKGEKCVIEKLKELVEAGKDMSGYYSYFLGKCYEREYGVEKDITKAFEYYKNAVELGCDEACCYLGSAYLFGEGTERNDKKAVEMFKRVCDKNKHAQNFLGLLYFRGKENGYDVEENKEYGLELLIKSVNNGFEDVVEQIKEVAFNGEKFVIEKLKELVEAGNDTKGYYSNILGNCYKFGYGVEKDMVKALELLKSSSELGCDEASFILGLHYFEEEGTEKNKEYGLELIKKAAEAGHEEAINKIKELEEKDNDSQLDKNINYFEKGVEEFKKGNYEQAEKEFENDKKIFLAENRDYKSKGNPYLAFMYYYGIGKEVDYEKAWKECNNVIEVAVRFEDYRDTEQVNNNIISHYLVGKMLNNGQGVKQNVEVAIREFKFIADEYKIKELIKEDYLFNIILNEYKETEAQYVYSLIYGPSATKEKFEEKDKVENNS